jgi:oxygen-independent coproporphyrinogen-3 oxidase
MATSSKKENYAKALCKEISHHNNELVNIKTIYIGGGTPSSLNIDLLSRLLQVISETVNMKNIEEYTIETNPNDISQEFIDTIKKYGINRVSIGVQTFNSNHLKFLGRSHNLLDINNSIKLLKLNKFNNISIDMIFSLVNQTIEELEYDLIEAVKLDVDHISYYSLILEEKTKLYYLYEQEKISMNSEDLEGLMYNKVINFLTSKGFTHYEISNFSKPSFESIHNKTYWLNLEYLGLGSGAHSQYLNKRFNNPQNVSRYIENINNDIFDDQFEYEYDALSDEMMLGLRLLKGIKISQINKKYNIQLLVKYPEINHFIENNVLEIVDGNLRFTRDGILLGNEVFMIFVEVE